MDNLPKDPPDQNNNSVPPPFGHNFNPHSNPVDPNNPYASQPPQQYQPPTPPIPTSPNPPNISKTLSDVEGPENPDALKHEHYSEAAQNKPRDEHGHFIHTNPDPQAPSSPDLVGVQSGQTPPTNPAPQAAPTNSSFLPPLIEINQNTKPSDKEDPPLFGFFLTNPVTYLKNF